MNVGRSLKNVGSQATDAAVKKADTTSMRPSTRGATRSSSPPPIRDVKPMRKQVHKGSSAGLRNEKTVRLEMIGAGYHNPANHRARNSSRKLPKMEMNFNTSLGFAKQSRTFDTRTHGNSPGSIGMMKERM